jgi:hypothetical protein
MVAHAKYNNEPTSEQVKLLWEHFGFKEIDPTHYNGYAVSQPSGYSYGICFPDITLDNIYKFIIPKIQYTGIIVDLISMEFAGYRVHLTRLTDGKEWDFKNDYNSPNLALFWAIWEYIDGKVS